MTNPHQPDDQLDDDEMERLLSNIVGDAAVTFPRREHLRRQMLAELERSESPAISRSTSPIHVARDNGSRDNGSRDEGLMDVPDAELFSFVGASREDAASFRRWRPLTAAATLVLVGTLALAALLQQESDANTIDAAGEHRTDVVGPTIEFELPAGVELLEERAGLVRLGRSGDKTEPRAVVSIVRPNSGDDLLGLIAELENQGLVNPVESRTVANREIVADWELRITNEAAERFACVAAGPCLPLGPIELWSRGVNFVTEVVGPDGETVWWVEQSSIHQDPFLEHATEILGTLRFD